MGYDWRMGWKLLDIWELMEYLFPGWQKSDFGAWVIGIMTSFASALSGNSILLSVILSSVVCFLLVMTFVWSRRKREYLRTNLTAQQVLEYEKDAKWDRFNQLMIVLFFIFLMIAVSKIK